MDHRGHQRRPGSRDAHRPLPPRAVPSALDAWCWSCRRSAIASVTPSTSRTTSLPAPWSSTASRPSASPTTLGAALLAYPWPGNVRELANVLERVMLLEDSPVVTAAMLSLLEPARVRRVGAGVAAVAGSPSRGRAPAAGDGAQRRAREHHPCRRSPRDPPQHDAVPPDEARVDLAATRHRRMAPRKESGRRTCIASARTGCRRIPSGGRNGW